MPREPRIYIEKVLYLITARGDEDRDLFNDSEDYAAYLTSLGEYKKEYGFNLYAYSIMPKSIYLLIELQNNVTISTIMHNLNSRYTKMYNSRYGKKGHLFQSRFKSKLFDKDEYLLRLTRYIHLLPKEDGASQDISNYAYSSYLQYIDGSRIGYGSLNVPDIDKEVHEVVGHFPDNNAIDDKHKGYASYVQSAGNDEVEILQKLMHRKAFIGSKEFEREMQIKVQEHIKEEENSHVVRKINPGYALAGSLVIIFLGIIAYNFYSNQEILQETLNKTSSGFEVAREDLTKHVKNLKGEIQGYEQKENYGLGGFAWELKLTPVQEELAHESFTDHLQFKGGQVISTKLMGKGFTPFNYTINQQTHGKMVWQTTQTNADGTTIRWYGIVAGDKMRGVLSENPVQGENRDFSFVSVRRVNDLGREQNVVQ